MNQIATLPLVSLQRMSRLPPPLKCICQFAACGEVAELHGAVTLPMLLCVKTTAGNDSVGGTAEAWTKDPYATRAGSSLTAAVPPPAAVRPPAGGVEFGACARPSGAASNAVNTARPSGIIACRSRRSDNSDALDQAGRRSRSAEPRIDAITQPANALAEAVVTGTPTALESMSITPSITCSAIVPPTVR